MKKNLLMLMALGASALTLWSQEPSYQNAPAPQQNPTQLDKPASMSMPETLMISGVECRLDKHILPQQRMEEYIYEGNSVVCNIYDYDWMANDWRNTAKSTSVYNQDGKLTLFESFNCPSNPDQWVGISRFEYQYDGNGHTILSAKYRWSESKNDWYCIFREESDFSERGMKINSAKWTSSKDDATLLTANIKTENVLYENGSIKEKINYSWDDQANDWVLSTKEALKYNQRGFTSERLISQWNTADQTWDQTEGYRYVYTYNERGKAQTVNESVWNKDNDLWQEKYITSFGYDQDGHKISRERVNANNDEPFRGFEKDMYQYNSLNQVSVHNAYEWSNDAQDWWLSYRDEFNFDQYGNVNSFVRLKWLEGSSECFGWQKWEREYTEEMKPALKAEYKWDSATKAWVGKSRQQIAKDELGLDLDLSVNYNWTADGWKESSYVAIDFNHDTFVATVTEYESGSDNVLSQQYYCYSPIGTTSITDIFELEAPVFNIEGNCISTTENGLITIFSIDGKLINSSVGKVEAPTTGFYIVKVGDKASKVYVK